MYRSRSLLCIVLFLVPLPAFAMSTIQVPIDPGPVGSTFSLRVFDISDPLADIPLDGSRVLLDIEVVGGLALLFDLDDAEYFGLGLYAYWNDIVNSSDLRPASANLIDVNSQLHPSAHVQAYIAGDQLGVETGWFAADNPDPIRFTNIPVSFNWPIRDPDAPDFVPGPLEFVSAELRLGTPHPNKIGVTTIPEPKPLMIWLILGACATATCLRCTTVQFSCRLASSI